VYHCCSGACSTSTISIVEPWSSGGSDTNFCDACPAPVYVSAWLVAARTVCPYPSYELVVGARVGTVGRRWAGDPRP
jgi:hypothetical protein